MKSLFAATVLSLSTLAVQAAPTLIDFDDQAAGTTITSQYAALGVTFFQASISDFTCCGTPTPTLVNASTGGDGGVRYPSLTMTFSSAASFVGFDFNYYGATVGAEALAFGEGGLLLETLAITTSAANALDPIAFSASDIESVEIRTLGFPSSGWLFAIDNLSFDTVGNVPEPGILAMLGLGLVSLVAARRKSLHVHSREKSCHLA